ncbi:MAG: alkaline phosphatase family protein, partial [Pseudomonadota bacterium]
FRIAETEKYAHVTFFFNGGIEQNFEGEERHLEPSPDVATYDLKPEMSAAAVTDRLVSAIETQDYDAMICNFANADMVGHTGNFDATVKCIETLDTCLGRVISAAQNNGVEVLITADHGNAENMRQHDGGPHTAHTNNQVPLIYIGRPAQLKDGGTLADIAPTLLDLMAIEIPAEMTGRRLVEFSQSAQDAA